MPRCIVVPVVLVEFCNFIVDVIIDVRLWYRTCKWRMWFLLPIHLPFHFPKYLCGQQSISVPRCWWFQWLNDAPGAAVLGGHQIVIKMRDNFARLTALLAKVCVWFNNLTIYLDFSAIFSQIAPSKPLNQGATGGRLFAAEGRHFDEASNVTPLGGSKMIEGIEAFNDS